MRRALVSVNLALSRNGIHIRTVAQRAAVGALIPNGRRVALLNRLGHRIHPGVRIAPGVTITGARLQIDDGVFVNTGCLLDATADLAIGARVHIGHGASLLTSTHLPGGAACRAGDNVALPVSVGAGAWIGAGAIVLPGARIGEGTVVASGAVVTGECEPDSLYAGVPAVNKRWLAASPPPS
jgi:maltose O-acetyltransferase